jgi:hypothetical protein
MKTTVLLGFSGPFNYQYQAKTECSVEAPLAD